jgi:hypothetical protein
MKNKKMKIITERGKEFVRIFYEGNDFFNSIDLSFEKDDVLDENLNDDWKGVWVMMRGWATTKPIKSKKQIELYIRLLERAGDLLDELNKKSD